MNDTPDNIDRFNLITLALLDVLYKEFPVPKKISADDIGASVVPQNAGEEAAFEYSTSAVNVVTWLAEEGYLRFQKQTYGGGFTGVRLSQKGLSVLGSVPLSVSQSQPKESIIVRIKQVLSKSAMTYSKEAVSELMTEIIRASVAYGMDKLP